MLKIFVAIDGVATIEEIKPRFHLTDEIDGHHLISKEVIFRDDERRMPALMLIWGGNGIPLSFKASSEGLAQEVEDTDFYKGHHARFPVSQRWPRIFAWAVRWLIRWFYFLFGSMVLGLGLYIVIVLLKLVVR